ncbi:MAG: hypothetical protein M3O62_11365 [Pseudomonadota bacterium]|nr:hypothetical protein [Pseudomonadota bacterium]
MAVRAHIRGLGLVLLALPAMAHTVATAAQATAVFNAIRSTPAQLTLYCEQDRLRDDSVEAYVRQDYAEVTLLGQRIDGIQDQLVGYKSAVDYVTRMAGDLAFFKTAEGGALLAAQTNLSASCGK